MKATHQGHCQVCNRVQNIQARNGKLAKHGYQVAGYGFFNGTCPGSDHLPLEQDKTMVEWSIKWAEESQANFKQARLVESTPVSQATAMWFNEYVVSNNRYIPSQYVWKRVNIYEETKQYSDGTPYQDKYFIGYDGKREPFMRYGLYGTLDEIANAQREKYITEHLTKRIKELQQYIREQQERIKIWHSQPLIEIKTSI